MSFYTFPKPQVLSASYSPSSCDVPSAEDTGIQRNSEGPHQPSIHTEVLFQEWPVESRPQGLAKAPVTLGLYAWDRGQHPGSHQLRRLPGAEL